PDLHLRLEILSGKRPHTPGFQTDENALRRVKEQTKQLQNRLGEKQQTLDPDAAGLLTALAYPERIAQREHSGLVRLVTGQKAKLATELFSEAEFYGIAHLETGNQPRVLLAAPLSKTELLQHFASQTERIQEIKWDNNSEKIVARQITKLGALILEESNLPKPDPDKMSEVFLEVIREKGVSRLPWNEEAQKNRQRLAFLHQL